jgi:hypothetical protein
LGVFHKIRVCAGEFGEKGTFIAASTRISAIFGGFEFVKTQDTDVSRELDETATEIDGDRIGTVENVEEGGGVVG